MSISQHDNLNTAQRLRKFLGVPERYRRRASAPKRSGRLIVEAMEPRYLLSGEGLVLPPPPPQSALHQPILVPPAQLAAQINAPTIVIDPGKVQTSPVSSQINEVIFLDPGVEGGTALIQQALANRPDARAEVVVLDANTDGVQQITSWLKQHQALQTIHLISHGDDAAIRLGSTTLNSDNLADYSASLEGWRGALGIDADILIYGCDVAADARGTDFVNRLATLTGADVAASTNATGAAKLGGDWMLESRTGFIDAAVLYDNSYAGLLALNATTLTLNAGLQTQIKAVLNKVDAVATEALKNNLINSALPVKDNQATPVVLDSINKQIGLTTTNGGTSGVFGPVSGLEAAALTYFTANGSSSTLSGLATALQTAMTAALPTAAGQPWVVSVTPTFDPSAAEVVAGFKISIGLGASNAGWTQTGLTLTTVTAGDWSGSSLSKVNIDIDAGLVLSGVTAATTDATTIATPANAASFFKFNHFGVSQELKPTGTANTLHLIAGIDTSLKDADNSDEKSRITLTDIASTGVAGSLNPTLNARIEGAKGSTGFFGQVASGALTLMTFTDTTLDATGNGLKTILAGAKKLGSQVDNLEVLGIDQPFVDTSMSLLLKTSDGRTLGDILSFKTPNNTTVVDDYLADSSVTTKTLGGLLQRLRDYLTGSGAYSSLEALVASSYVNDFMDITGTIGGTGQAKLVLGLALSRDFQRRFSFDDKLRAVGLDFMPGSSVALRSTVNIGLNYDSNVTTSLQITQLNARVQTPSSQFDAGVSLGILEGRATGTLSFDTGTVSVLVGQSYIDSNLLFGAIDISSVQIGNPSALTPAEIDAFNVSPDVYQSSVQGNVKVFTEPSASGAASFDVTGTIGAGTANATTFTMLEGGTPHVTVSFNGGAPSTWSTIKAHPLLLSTANFTKLQAFASLDSAALVRMLTDLGTYLNQLRDSGSFNSLLPFTNLTLGQTLDFSAALNSVVANDLQTTLRAGVTAARRSSFASSAMTAVIWSGKSRCC